MAESPEPVSVTEPGSLNPDSDLPSNGRVEIDTSTQFESVREAANRFGGFGFWRPTHNYKPPGAFQMLAKSSSGDETWSKKSEGKENGKRSVTRKRFAKIAMLLKKESKNKKKIALKLR
ncbi:hypothetical protein F2Q69_00001856 [Brassica cretica]|uniref:Uncharacterized protein n=1 Tax=Brassica cretica TaxID=69181 RepID=A0A8S9P3X9_BRACR|nr:hypothetical protein F2Q69_00001856 [Brassica cretica]